MAAERSALRSGIDHAAMLCREDDGTPFLCKTVVIAAHPDDETIGMGGRLHRFKHISIVHATDGAPLNMGDALKAGFTKRAGYARARKAELEAALALAGIGARRQLSVGLADQTAALRLPTLIRALTDILACLKPDLVLTHPYEGGHPDHDATALAVHAALELLRKRNVLHPQLIEFTSYHMRGGRMATSEFIPYEGCKRRTAYLSAKERCRKESMVRCFTTQREVLKAFPVQTESFRAAPRYNFTRRPHEGTLYYECFHWGLTHDLWQSKASRVLRLFNMTGLL